ncbi:uncharacterized protein LOC118744664 [Rhagoletis pomonella]|uniref:uncharacterized protein LOC118744664 n=1 Tax=Rhagoletis pomonella TaxID=28610 RepID=UPI00177DBFEF|nr:uncharacterized protein LOC118744664 [Rhagoletis pomonella]XP_036333723.1 uncharacterized protein LOC118744664 [Rhagoletis pomonella]XP_036333724.1 uncharacterized protein LOC118744664 [Rhagoletis pomonella]XP_036333725.1 uncharacterized protein LOC118744664 [Rhagoletis pomonella]XP_036333726.1 uncharacterized protein LOC118744664 [Rhagoletis pomonella]
MQAGNCKKTNMDFRILCLFIIIKWSLARQTLSPTATRQQALYFHSLQYYPKYQIINALPENKEESTSTEIPTSTKAPTTSTTTEANFKQAANTIENTNIDTNISTTVNLTTNSLEASTDNTIYTAAEFPHDLLEIARSKLGLRSLDEVPSISELAEFLGTSNAEETIKYIRQLTNTDQGIELIKAYLESADFTDRTEESRRGQQQQEMDGGRTIVESTKPKSNLLERLAAYFHIYNLWPQSNGVDAADARKQVQQQLSKYIKPQLQYRKRMQAAAAHHGGAHPTGVHHPHKPLLIRNPLPYHYPIPFRPVFGNRLPQHNDAAAGNPMSTTVHLNTPKFYVPSHIQLARAANIPPQQLQTLLQSKPKLAELAAKVSHLPLTNDRSSPIDAQLLAAVKRAVEHDEDLRKLLQATAETLK